MEKDATIPKTVDEYIARQPERMRPMLEQVRAEIKAAAPQAEELISYQMPGYKYKGYVVYFAAWKDHIGLYAINKNILKDFKDELKNHPIKGTTIHFSPENPLPEGFLTKVVHRRIEENEKLYAVKQAKKAENRRK